MFLLFCRFQSRISSRPRLCRIAIESTSVDRLFFFYLSGAIDRYHDGGGFSCWGRAEGHREKLVGPNYWWSIGQAATISKKRYCERFVTDLVHTPTATRYARTEVSFRSFAL